MKEAITMKTGVTVSIPVAMIFKKYSCPKCSNRLQRKKFTCIYTPDHPDYPSVKERIYDQNTLGTGDLSVSEYRLFCPVCQTVVTLDQYKKMTQKTPKQ